MFGWFKKQHNRKAQAGAAAGISKKDMRKGGKVVRNPMADRIEELKAEGYTYQGTLKAEGPMKGATIMVKKPEGGP